MPNYSARDMLLRMAEGGPVTYGKGATAADLLAAEQRILGEIAASPDTWDVATAYNAILESGVSVDDALAAGVQQSTIDAIFTSGAPLPETFSTPASVGSGFAAAPYAGKDLQPFYTQAQDYVTGLMADGLTDAERREAQTLATQGGFTFQDFAAAGVDPSILFTQPASPVAGGTVAGGTVGDGTVAGGTVAGGTVGDGTVAGGTVGDGIVLPKLLPGLTDAEKAAQLAASQAAFTNTQADYTAPSVYQPIDFDPSIYAEGEEALNREFRDSAPRTEVTDQYGNLAGFDYKPAASLLSATGSGFSFTPPSVTSRPRSLMDTGTLNRYTQGRAAQDLRQLTGANYDQYSGLLNRTGSYGGGLSRSQLYALTRQQDSQRARAPEEEVTSTTGTISDYLRLNEDIGIDYAAAKAAGTIPAGTTLQAFGLNHYNTYGRDEIAAGKRAPFTLAPEKKYYTQPAIGQFGEGDEESRQSNFTTTGYDNELLARDLGPAGGAIIRPVFAEGGLVKKPEGFADGGSASADLKALGHYKNGGLIDSAIKKGAEALGFDDERQVAISQEAVELTNSMVDAGLIGEQYRVELLMPKEGSERTRQNTGIKGDEEVFNAVNHALFSYDAGQSTVASMGAQAKEVIQGLQKKASGKDPRSEYLDYFNNQFGFNLAKQGLSRQEAKNAIMDTIGNINNQGTRGRMTRGEEVTPGIDLLTNVQDAKYPWE